MHELIPKGIVGGFEYTVFQFNSKENKIIAREPMNVRELNYRKVTKVDLTATASRALY